MTCGFAMATDKYQFSCALHGHGSDVRAVAVGLASANSLITCSRDGTVVVWLSGSEGYRPTCRLVGHQGYVGSVCSLLPCEGHPSGLIASGGQKGDILLHDIDSVIGNQKQQQQQQEPENIQPLMSLKGGDSAGVCDRAHESAVSTLAAAKFGVMVSGSWDCSVRVWQGGRLQYTLEGHEAAVWAVATLPSAVSSEPLRLLSAGADRRIVSWSGQQQLRVFRGHSDCVRGLAVLSAEEFVSCSNDATLRRWSLQTGRCTAVLSGHTNFVYSVAALPNGVDLVSSGEDRTMRVWCGGGGKREEDSREPVQEEPWQTVYLPARSVWSVVAVENGDIAAGCSDSQCYVFSVVQSRHASPDKLSVYQQQLDSVQLSHAAGDLGDLRPDQVASSEVLLRPGSRDNQTVVVREADSDQVSAYQWMAGEQRWNRLGHVVGASNKQLHSDGRQYDFVFSVDVLEGAPPLKLPYNRGDDPWLTAQNFIHQHDLSQQYLEQVANFIIANSGDKLSTNGVGRNSGSSQHTDQPTNDLPHFPQTGLLFFDKVGNMAGMTSKLLENSRAVSAEDCRLPESQLSGLVELLAGSTDSPALDAGRLEQLHQLLSWPADRLLPVLDLLRLAVRSESVCEQLCSADSLSAGENAGLLSAVTRMLDCSGQQVGRMVALRLICNIMRSPSGLLLVRQHQHDLVAAVLSICSDDSIDRGLQVASATVLFNLAVSYARVENCTGGGATREELVSHIVCSLVTCIQRFSDEEARYRVLVALGTVLSVRSQYCQLVKELNCSELLSHIVSASDHGRVAACVSQLRALLSRST